MKTSINIIKYFFIALASLCLISLSYGSHTKDNFFGQELEDIRPLKEKPNIRNRRLVGGINANVTHYPWMLSMMLNGRVDRYRWCATTLISPQFAMTASHCINNQKYGLYVGDNKDWQEPNNDMEIIESYKHPKFNYTLHAGNDIALIKLKQPIFNLTPVNINKNGVTHGMHVKEVGWKTQKAYTPKYWDSKLNELSSNVNRPEDCPDNNNHNTLICVNHGLAHKSSCAGDSGDPLIVKDDSGHWNTQIGINSFGEGCADFLKNPNYPKYSTYTNVSYYRDFIYQYTRNFGGEYYDSNKKKSRAGVHILGDDVTHGLKVHVHNDTPRGSGYYLELYTENGQLIKRYGGDDIDDFNVLGRYIKVVVSGEKDISEFCYNVSVDVTPTDENLNFIDNQKDDKPYYFEQKDDYVVWGTGEYDKKGTHISPELFLEKNEHIESWSVDMNLSNLDGTNCDKNNDILALYDKNNFEIYRIQGCKHESFSIPTEKVTAKLYADNEGSAKGAVVLIMPYEEKKLIKHSWCYNKKTDQAIINSSLTSFPEERFLNISIKLPKNIEDNGYHLKVFNKDAEILRDIENYNGDQLLVRTDAFSVEITTKDGSFIDSAHVIANKVTQDSKLQSGDNYRDKSNNITSDNNSKNYIWYLNGYKAGTDIISLPLEINTGGDDILWLKTNCELQEDDYIIIYDENMEELYRFDSKTDFSKYTRIAKQKIYARLILKNQLNDNDYYVSIIDHHPDHGKHWDTKYYAKKKIIESPTWTFPGHKWLMVKVNGHTKSGEGFISLYDQYNNQIRRFSGSISKQFYVRSETVKAVLTNKYEQNDSEVEIEVYHTDPNDPDLTDTASYVDNNKEIIWKSGSYDSQENRQTPLMAFANATWLRASITGEINNNDKLILFDKLGNIKQRLSGEMNHCLYWPFDGIKAELDSSEGKPMEGLAIKVMPYNYGSCEITWPDDVCQELDKNKPFTITVVGAKDVEVSTLPTASTDETANSLYDLLDKNLTTPESKHSNSIAIIGNSFKMSSPEEGSIPVFSLAIIGWSILPEYSVNAATPPLSLSGQESIRVSISGNTRKNKDFLTVLDDSGYQVKRVSGLLDVAPVKIPGKCIRFSLTANSENWLNIQVTPLNETIIPSHAYYMTAHGDFLIWQVSDYSNNEERISPPLSLNLENGQFMDFNLLAHYGNHYIEVLDASGEILHNSTGASSYNLITKNMGITVILRSNDSFNGQALIAIATVYRGQQDLPMTIQPNKDPDNTGNIGAIPEVSLAGKILIFIIASQLYR